MATVEIIEHGEVTPQRVMSGRTGKQVGPSFRLGNRTRQLQAAHDASIDAFDAAMAPFAGRRVRVRYVITIEPEDTVDADVGAA